MDSILLEATLLIYCPISCHQ